jgi:N-acetylglucosaminyldiphosphoundecaprenol N-acetyl-beta-D-mannosaminyltransferase
MNALLKELVSRIVSTDLASIEAAIETAVRTGTPIRIGYLNAQVCAEARSHELLRRFLRECEILLPDGAPIAWLSRRMRRAPCAKVTVTDILPLLLRLADAQCWEVLLIGSSAITQTAFTSLCSRNYPGIRLTTVPFNFRDEQSVSTLDTIFPLRTDFLLIALGAPHQEDLFVRHQTSMSAGISLACGGAIDVAAGMKKRAPQWMHGLGLEWIYRLVLEPRRLFVRYLKTNLVFLGMLLFPGRRQPPF